MGELMDESSTTFERANVQLLERLFRGLGRTQIIGRTPEGSVISEEGLFVSQFLNQQQLEHELKKQGNGGGK